MSSFGGEIAVKSYYATSLLDHFLIKILIVLLQNWLVSINKLKEIKNLFD